MLGRIIHRLARGQGLPWACSIALLLLPVLLPGSEWIATCRGGGGIRAELEQAQTRGYYEGLLDAGHSEAKASRPDSAVVEAPPPPGWTPFVDSGLVEQERTYLRWRLRPNQEARWNGTTFRTNSLGFRSPEVAPEKPARTYRIVAFGSSNTMGHGVDDEDIYLRLLERWLDAATPPSLRVEVVNAAISADSPTRRLLRMRLEADRLDPDLVLCDASILDFSLETEHLGAVVRDGLPVPFPFVADSLRRSGVSASDPPGDFTRKLWREFDRLLDGAYAGWAEESRRLGVPLMVVLLPRADDKVENPRLVRKLSHVADRHGIEMIDLSGAFDHLEVDQFRVAPWEMHPSELGHRAIFEGLREEIRSRGRLPGLAAPIADVAEPGNPRRDPPSGRRDHPG